MTKREGDTLFNIIEGAEKRRGRRQEQGGDKAEAWRGQGRDKAGQLHISCIQNPADEKRGRREEGKEWLAMTKEMTARNNRDDREDRMRGKNKKSLSVSL